MLEPILKGLIEWLYGMMVDIMAYMSGELIGVMSMDLAYFERIAPVIRDIVTVLTALGWALLIGNLVFQMVKAMMSGIGFEAEDPKITFLRTAVFAFLLSVSKEICAIGLGITNKVITLLQLPESINIVTPDESMFTLGSGAKWLLVIIVGVVLMVQMLKLLFEIGERYVVCGVLTFFAPLAFSMGGSKNTNDIFKGWCRMYCSMLVMMIMNIVFLKLIMSAMAQMSSGGVLIWLVFVVALTRVARKIDSHIGKIGLNPAQTGNALGSRLPGVMTMMAVRAVSGSVSRSIAAGKSSTAARRGNDRKSTAAGNMPPNGTRGQNSTKQNPSGTKLSGMHSSSTSQSAENMSRQTAKGQASEGARTETQTRTERPNGTRPPVPRSTAKDSKTTESGGTYQSREREKAERDRQRTQTAQPVNTTKGTHNNANRDSKYSTVGGNVNIEGAKSSSRDYAENSAEFSRESREYSDSARWNNESNKINHEYVNGRYNPAARNKKAKRRGYRKYTKDEEERGGRDRKQKR